jgi:hypothetical protein
MNRIGQHVSALKKINFVTFLSFHFILQFTMISIISHLEKNHFETKNPIPYLPQKPLIVFFISSQEVA